MTSHRPIPLLLKPFAQILVALSIFMIVALPQATEAANLLAHQTEQSEGISAQEISAIRSDPENGATLDRPARTVRVWFDQTPSTSESSIELTGPGTGTDRGATIEGMHSMGENDLMARVVGSMPNGEYTLTWKVGEVTGAIKFSVKRGALAPMKNAYEPPLDIGIILYDGAEPLDVFGPAEMWMNAGPELIRVHFIAEEKKPIALATTSYPAALAPKVEAQYSFDDAPDLDVLMVPGGIGTLREVNNERMLEWLSERHSKAILTTSVCTGSAILAKAGILDNAKATGNKMFFDYIAEQGPKTEWVKEARWVESGNLMTSSGVSAGIDMSLAVIARFFGAESARMIAAGAEYEWQEDSSADPFTKYLNAAMPAVEQLLGAGEQP